MYLCPAMVTLTRWVALLQKTLLPLSAFRSLQLDTIVAHFF